MLQRYHYTRVCATLVDIFFERHAPVDTQHADSAISQFAWGLEAPKHTIPADIPNLLYLQSKMSDISVALDKLCQLCVGAAAWEREVVSGRGHLARAVDLKSRTGNWQSGALINHWEEEPSQCMTVPGRHRQLHASQSSLHTNCKTTPESCRLHSRTFGSLRIRRTWRVAVPRRPSSASLSLHPAMPGRMRFKHAYIVVMVIGADVMKTAMNC